jgi:hypothetical protein
VLEVGAGAGSQLVALAAANPSGETVGRIDLADGMLREGRHHHGVGRVGVRDDGEFDDDARSVVGWVCVDVSTDGAGKARERASPRPDPEPPGVCTPVSKIRSRLSSLAMPEPSSSIAMATHDSPRVALMMTREWAWRMRCRAVVGASVRRLRWAARCIIRGVCAGLNTGADRRGT